MPENRSATIADSASMFLRTKRWSHLYTTVRMIVRQRRFIEASYGAMCFLTKKPGRVRPDSTIAIADILEEAKVSFALLKRQKDTVVLDIARYRETIGAPFNCTIHGFILTEQGFIAGAYANHSSQLLVKTDQGYVTHEFYERNRGVRHIHSILRHDEHAFVSTGDSSKYLDRYRIVNGNLRFEKRILRHLGGFTTCGRADGKDFFGTDFSERPNYIYCLQTRSKYFFPRPAYTQWCYLMLPLHDRYLFCLNTHLTNVSQRKSIAIFDTRSASFIYCQEYTGTDYMECDVDLTL